MELTISGLRIGVVSPEDEGEFKRDVCSLSCFTADTKTWKKMSRQNAAAINLSFPTPGKGKLFHIWGKITDFDWEKEVGFSFYNRELNKTGGNSR